MEKSKIYRRLFSAYGGVLIAASYGLAVRLLMEDSKRLVDIGGLFTITFVGVLPFVMGAIPMLVASEKQLKSWIYRAGAPALSVFVFILLCFLTETEDLLCVLIISIPFVVSAMVAGLLTGYVVRRIKKNRGTLYAVMLLPLVTGWVGAHIDNEQIVETVSNEVVIAASAQQIWPKVVRVAEIQDAEYNAGILNAAGIPRPLYATLDADGPGGRRVGHFTDGMTLEETITEWVPDKRVSFSIRIPPQGDSLSIFRKHVMGSGHVRFVEAAYTLQPLGGGKTKLTLASTYELQSEVNNYGRLWGQILLSDFQDRLLAVIAKRCERAATVATQ